MRSPVPSTWRDPIERLIRLVCLVCVVAGIGFIAALDIYHYAQRTRGIESGLAADQPPLITPRFGVNVSLEQYPDEPSLDRALAIAHDAGFGAVRQYARWADLEPLAGAYDWRLWDRIVPAVERHELQLIVVLSTSPGWARPDWEQENPEAPPADMANLARFAEAFAGRHAGHVLAYQVWDEPNVAPHWGAGAVDPAGYVEMLRVTSEAIHRADPGALVIGGGLAPNTETGGRNMSDVRYLQEIYRRGAGDYLDVLGVKAYGFWSGAYDRRIDADVLNFSRTILLRREMLRRGDGAKPLWALDSGWNALPGDWAGPLPPQGTDSPATQSDRLARAMERVRQEWPWMTLMVTQHLQPAAPPDDPVWGFSLLDSEGNPRAVLGRVSQVLSDDTIYPGLTPLTAQGQPAVTGGARFRFWGSDLLLHVERGLASEVLTVWVDALTREVPVDLESANAGPTRVRIGRPFAVGTHLARLVGEDSLPAARALQVGHQPALHGPWGTVLIGLAVVAWALSRAWREARLLPWRVAWRWVRARWLRTPPALQAGVLACGLATALLAPSQIARLAGLGVLGLGACLRPDLALIAVVACVPLAPLRVRLGPGSFSPVEVTLLVALAGRVWSALMAPPSPRRTFRRWIGARPLADWAVVALVLLGLLASLLSEYRHEALREWRIVLLESALFYALLRLAFRDARLRLRLVDVLWLAGLAVALCALAIYPLPEGVIEAEGVRRARAFYGSPNNLALFLERVLPLGLALAWHGASRRRRRLYGLGILPILLAVVLTFSRGALVLGLPAAGLWFAWSAHTRAGRVISALVVVGALVALPLVGAGRLDSLMDPTHGTTFLRLSLWQAGLEMVRDHPLLGVGPDNFLYYYGDYIRPGAEVDRWLSHPHNIVLDFWLRLGIGGLVVAAGMVAGLVRGARRVLARRDNDDVSAVTIGIVGGALAALAHGLIDASFFVTELAFWWMFALAWCVTLARCGLHVDRDPAHQTILDGGSERA